MKNIFTQTPVTKIGSNVFDLTHEKKLSAKIGKLIPILCMEAVPGDYMKIRSSIMIRFAPMVAPVMHRVNAYVHYFFVPNRIMWPNWEKFITGGERGLDNPSFPRIKPYEETGIITSTLMDYMGLPNTHDGNPAQNEVVSAMPFYAYQMIYNEYYRDQNLIDPINVVLDKLIDGDNTPAYFSELTTLRTRAWQHDYFTSALPWTQKGPEAMLPLGNSAPITFSDTTKNQVVRDVSGDLVTGPTDWIGNDPSGELADSVQNLRWLDLNGTHIADLSQATASSIIDLRRAFKLQEWLEKNARGGSRYIESIAVHFGVKSSDGRLARPEYLGGFSSPVQVSEVLQMSETAATPLATMGGHGLSVGAGTDRGYYCEEHGYFMAILSIMPMSNYQQGIPKHFLKFDRFEHYWPEFAHIGEQPIINRELWLESGFSNQNDDIFGYTPRYAEYKYIPSTVHGEFKSTLDFWHMGRIFATRPSLNQDFIECDASEVDRVFAVSDVENMYIHVLNNIEAKRKMPYFSSPKM